VTKITFQYSGTHEAVKKILFVVYQTAASLPRIEAMSENRAVPAYGILEHTADIEFRACGAPVADLFATAAYSLMAKLGWRNGWRGFVRWESLRDESLPCPKTSSEWRASGSILSP
jgi:hypothetical protein